MDFIDLYFGEVMVIDSPSHTVSMTQIEHFTVDENLDGNIQERKLY
jgi:hypothetical protein